MAGNVLDFEKPLLELEALLAELRRPEKRAEALATGIDLDAEVARLESELRRAAEQVFASLTPWEETLLARHKNRPYSLDYIRMVFDQFMELSGDRLAANDEAVVGGPAFLGDRPVVVIGQQKGRDLRERQRRNFGSARAPGFRKALRLARLAERFGRPLISFVDTSAAAADLRAEEHGVSEAIAHNMAEMSFLGVPIVVIVIGEGGSGGAMGMAVGDRVLMLEHSVFSVIPPEGCAAILWRDKERTPEAACALKLTAQSARELGIVEHVLPEPLGGAHRDPPAMAADIRTAIVDQLDELDGLSPDELRSRRYERYRRIGEWTSVPPEQE
ncbi:MAG: acetyl-CoA carboxylase carboxyltransferase subunit alpha [Armatimonadetes bacterium]|nr:acetyl-CoA carboxylase carboxyltransferase subunit alpha [Armatimonadota bacterium]